MRNRAWAAPLPDKGRVTLSLSLSLAVVASFFGSIMGATSVSAQSIDTALAETVPAESVMYVDADLNQTSEQWTQFYALLERAGLSDLAEDQADVSPEEVGDLAEMYEYTGEAAIVITSPDGLTSEAFSEVTEGAMDVTEDPLAVADSAPEGMVAVFQPDDPEALHASFVENIENRAEEFGGAAETSEYNGVTITSWESTTEDSGSMATALADGTVIVSWAPEELEVVIDTINGDVESLATSESFQSVAGAFTTESISFGYLDATTIAAEAAEEDAQLADAMAGYDVSATGYFGWNLYVDDLGFRMDTVVMSEDGITPTLLDPTLAGRIPASSLLFVNGTDIAGSGLSEALGVFLQLALADTGSMDVSTPVATPSVEDVYAELETQIGFNINDDLIAQLDGEWALAASAEQIFSAEPQFDVVFVSEVADEATVTDTTEKIEFLVSASVDEESVSVTDREVEGGTVTTVTLIDAMGPGVPTIIEWAVIDGEFLIGMNNGVDSYLDGNVEALADDPIYQQTFDALPSTDLVSIQFVNLDRTIPMIEEAVTSLESSMSVLDNDETCGEYATQEEAQAAYDEDEFGLWMLDLDYDGEACEDFFTTTNAASPEASPESLTEDLEILSAGSVTYVEGDMYRTSSIILIGE
jgi:hypothetical protein